MSERFLVNPALESRQYLKNAVKNVGVDIRDLGVGGARSPLKEYLETSLLTGHGQSAYEKYLLLGSKNYTVTTLIDVDGVLASPIHLNSIGLENLLWLRKVSQLSDHTLLWTSRMETKGILKECACFPFLGEEIVERLEKLGKGKLEVITNKTMSRSRADALKEIVEIAPGSDITYYIGSSVWDRKAVYDFSKASILPQRLVYYDTGHLIL